MSYTVFARKYRPQSFAELVGQEHVARTLGNAIAAGRVAHAFLFTGVRGVGKTTTARIMAKALNCETGPTVSPCNRCSACLEITSGTDMDVQEIDGASHNSVDDVRRLQETLPFRPTRDRFKVVIVDEVHMLSVGAFNAFLKTLEEPPPHVKFIFATTESHKVPVTIRSRCQRYDFRLIPQTAVAERVREILQKEEISFDEDVVALVARESAGSMRDALTLLDQVVAFGGRELVGAEIGRLLGMAGQRALLDCAHRLVTRDAHAVLRLVDESLNQGIDAFHFVKQLLSVMRDVVVTRVTSSDSALVDLTTEDFARAREIAGASDPVDLQRVFAMLTKVADEVTKASSSRMALEMGLVRVASRPALGELSELIAELRAMEARGATAGPDQRRSVATETRQSPPEAAPRPSAAPRPVAPQHGSAAPQRPVAAQPARSASSKPQMPWEAFAGGPRESSSPASPVAPPSADEEPHRVSSRPAIAIAQPPPTETRASVRSDEAPLLRPALQAWERIVGRLRSEKPALAAVLEHGVPRVVSRERVVVSFQVGSFYGRQAEAPAARDAVAEVALQELGGKPILEVRFDAVGGAVTVATVEASRRDAEKLALRRAATQHPAVLDALEVFPSSRSSLRVKLAGE